MEASRNTYSKGELYRRKQIGHCLNREAYFPIFLFIITISSCATQKPNPTYKHYLGSPKEDSIFLNQILKSCPLF